MSDDARITVYARMVVKPGRGDEFVERFRPLVDQAAAEPGTESFVLSRSRRDPDVFWLAEIYTDRAALDAHAATETFARISAELEQLIAERELVFGRPVLDAGKG